MLDDLIKLVLAVIGLLKPGDIAKVKEAIEQREAEIVEENKKMREAVATGDIETINRLFFGD